MIPLRKPTPAEVKTARLRAGLSQTAASIIVFGPDSSRTFQNWEGGKTRAALSAFIFFLLMTKQITVIQARKAQKEYVRRRKQND